MAAKRRFGSKASFWTLPTDVGSYPESNRNSDLPDGRLSAVPEMTFLDRLSVADWSRPFSFL